MLCRALQEQAGGSSSLLRELYSQQRALAIEFRLMQLDKFYNTFMTELESEFEHQVGVTVVTSANVRAQLFIRIAVSVNRANVSSSGTQSNWTNSSRSSTASAAPSSRTSRRTFRTSRNSLSMWQISVE